MTAPQDRGGNRPVEGDTDRTFAAWMKALEARHLKTLELREVRRALQALSSLYVERREKIAAGAALSSAGKRAAFALFYGPLHFLFVREVVRVLGAHLGPRPRAIVDLGCGTGVAGAAWALLTEGPPPVMGVDVSRSAIDEARLTYRSFGLTARVRSGALERVPLAGRPAVVAAYAVNELTSEARATLLPRFLSAARAGARILVVEPIARRPVPWWDDWSECFRAEGGRDDRWRFAVELPELVRKLDSAAGLDHRELTGRSLYLPGTFEEPEA